MTPQEIKAKEIVEMFTFNCKECDNNWKAKQCAIALCDSHIDWLIQYVGMHDQDFIDADVRFWQEVKSIVVNKY